MKNVTAKILLSATLASALSTGFTGCGEDTNTTAGAAGTGEAAHHTALCTSATTTSLSGTISSDTTLDATACYSITGTVKVAAATLTIPAGTILYGTSPQSYLAILPGAKIDATGTATNPIVFTSAEEVSGAKGEPGQWGGLSIFGNAADNKGTENYEADATITFGKLSTASDVNNTEDSGTLNYVMIRNTGYAVTADAELNGLSLGAVGNTTSISNIASINGGDDGMEIWGGTVNLTNIYIRNAQDDSYDLDHGFTGTATNLWIQTSATSDRGIEADSKSDDDAGTPRAKPTITNFTITTVDGSDAAMHWRQGIQPTLNNGKITYAGTTASTYAIEVNNDTTAGTAIASASNVQVKTDSSLVYLAEDAASTTLPSGITTIGSTTAFTATGATESDFTWITDYETAKGL